MNWAQTWLDPHLHVNPLGFRASCLLHNHPVFVIECDVFLLDYLAYFTLVILCFVYLIMMPFPTHHQTARIQRVVDSIIHLFHSILYVCIHSGGCDLV